MSIQSTLSQSADYSYPKDSSNDHPQRSYSKSRRLSGSEDTSVDVLTDLLTLEEQTSQKIPIKRARRYSELKPSILQHKPPMINERRNSVSHISFSSLLPNPFRSNKNSHKNMKKDDTNSTTNLFNNTHNTDMMQGKNDAPSSPLKSQNSILNDSQINLLAKTDSISSHLLEDSLTSLSSTTSQFQFDGFCLNPRSLDTIMLKLHTPLCVTDVYRNHFYDYYHVNYCGELERDGPFIASIRCVNKKSNISDTNDISQARAIIRTPNNNYDVSVTLDGTKDENILQKLISEAQLSPAQTAIAIGDPKANEKIYKFDILNDAEKCKIGFIYQCRDQIDEFEIFGNDELPQEAIDFLSLLSERVTLKGFNKYRGDLDVKDNSHGLESYYTEYKNYEIMFNVAPIIPSNKKDQGCTKRKGLVGNALVCIVFQERFAEFKPNSIATKVVQVYITVEPMMINNQLYYKVGTWHKNGINTMIDPPGGIYLCDESFRDYFLTLLLNSINAAIESPSLKFPILKHKQRSKKEAIKDLSEKLCQGQTIENPDDFENISELSHNTSKTQLNATLSLGAQSSKSNSDFNGESIQATKRQGLKSRFMNAIYNRSQSNSSSTPSPSEPNNPTFNQISSFKSYSIDISSPTEPTNSLVDNEAVRRAASVKRRRAPLPPPETSTAPSSNNLSNNENPIGDDRSLNTVVFQQPVRSRSNSTPNGDGFGIKLTRSRLGNVSKINEESFEKSNIDEAQNDDKSLEKDFVQVANIPS